MEWEENKHKMSVIVFLNFLSNFCKTALNNLLNWSSSSFEFLCFMHFPVESEISDFKFSTFFCYIVKKTGHAPTAINDHIVRNGHKSLKLKPI